MPTQEQRQKFEEIKAKKEGKTQPEQGFQGNQEAAPKGRKSETDEAIHGTFEQVGGAIATRGQQKLNQFVKDIVKSRQIAVNQAADILEMADSGELDVQLLVAEMQRRRERRAIKQAPNSFEFEYPNGFDPAGYGIDLDAAVTTVMLDSGLHRAKAIAGV